MTESPKTHLQDIATMLTDSIVAVEDVVDNRWRRLKRRFGWDGQPKIQPYTGYANEHYAWFHGRVLTNPPAKAPADDDDWWDNLLQTYTRFESDEVPGVDVEIDFAGSKHIVTTDEEGYFHLEAAFHPSSRAGHPWQSIAMRLVDETNRSANDSLTVSQLLMPRPSAEFGVISDIDDTILQTGVLNLLAMARLTFLHNARTRKTLVGVSALYRSLQVGTAPSSPRQNPIFYVSSSPWNLYDLLEDFLELNDIPYGPMLLQDLGLNRQTQFSASHDHKLEKALRIMAAYPDLPFVLFGDSGQEDARLYAEAIEQRPHQVKAVFIRDVDPYETSTRDQRVADAIRQAEAHGVPMTLVADSIDAAKKAIDLGLLPREALDQVAEETSRDRARG